MEEKRIDLFYFLSMLFLKWLLKKKINAAQEKLSAGTIIRSIFFLRLKLVFFIPATPTIIA